jgi:hypothetical protein
MSQGVPTAITIAAIVSFILAYFPLVSGWFDTLTSQQKAVTVIVLMFVVGIGTFVSTNSVEALANSANWIELAQNIASAILASQIFNEFANKPLEPAKTGEEVG